MKSKIFVHDMIHNNPGLEKYETNYSNPQFLKSRGYDAKVFDLFDCAQFGLLWDYLDNALKREKVYPIGSSERKWACQKKKELTAAYTEVKNQGLEVYFMMDMIVLPKRMRELYPEVLNQSGKIDILSPMMLTLLEFMFEEMLQEFPQVDGIYIRYGETYVGEYFNTPYHFGNNPIQGDNWEYHQYLINFLMNKVCIQYNKKIMYRTWGFGDLQFNKDTYLALSDRIPPHQNFFFCIKHTEGDFHRTFRFNQCLNVGKHQQVVEVQAAREYEGKGAYPNYIGDGIINGFEEYKWLMKDGENKCLKDVVTDNNSMVKGIWTWSRGGGWDGPYINGRNGKNGCVGITNGCELWADLNAYVVSKWAKNRLKNDRDYVLEYAMDELGMNKRDAYIFYDICIKSSRAVLLGRGTITKDYDTDVFWTRDQNIEYRRILGIIKSSIDKDAFDVLLYERNESVKIWKEMIVLANEIHNDVECKSYIVTTCLYGYLLFSIYECIYKGNGYAMLGNHKCEIDLIVAQYDKLWDEWENLKLEQEGCPSLYAKEDKILDLVGYNWNTGLDAAINPLRDLDESGCIKIKYIPEELKLNEWGLMN